MLVVVTAAVIGTACGDNGPVDPTASFTPVQLTESRFVVEWPYNVPLDARYDFSGGVCRMWVYATDKPFSRTLSDAARTESNRWLQSIWYINC
jgi:hypothetical protein